MARDGMANGKRYEGLTCYVKEEQKEYQLVGGTANIHWRSVPTPQQMDVLRGFNDHSFVPTYDENGQLVSVEEKIGETVIRSFTLTYDVDDLVATVAETYDGETVTSTLNYTSGSFVSVDNTVSPAGG
ncbi:hypothetical protein [Domibacillus aminovorans]|nr:hypothetical protein [Domibacillus aminovorans]